MTCPPGSCSPYKLNFFSNCMFLVFPNRLLISLEDSEIISISQVGERRALIGLGNLHQMFDAESKFMFPAVDVYLMWNQMTESPLNT